MVRDMPVPASEGPPADEPGLPDVVDVAGVCVADSASTATCTVPPSTLTTFPTIVAAPGTAVVTVDNDVGSAIEGSVIVRPVIDAVALCVDPTVDVPVCPLPMLTDGGVKATPGTLFSTSLSVLVTEPTAEVSCDGTASLPRIFSVPTLASATGVGECDDAIAFVTTLMLPRAASGSVSPVTALSTPVTSACNASMSALRLSTRVCAAAAAAAAALCTASALTTAFAASTRVVSDIAGVPATAVK